MKHKWTPWRPWTDGPCPVPPEQIVQAKLYEQTLSPMPAELIGWDCPHDPVLAYRVQISDISTEK